VNFVPISNRVSDKRCSLESVLLAPNASLEGTGFKSNATLTMISESEGERHDGRLNADADGNPYFAMGQGKGQGERCDQADRLVGGVCSSLAIKWGKDSYDYQ
jgi:hypothetical protein